MGIRIIEVLLYLPTGIVKVNKQDVIKILKLKEEVGIVGGNK